MSGTQQRLGDVKDEVNYLKIAEKTAYRFALEKKDSRVLGWRRRGRRSARVTIEKTKVRRINNANSTMQVETEIKTIKQTGRAPHRFA